MTYGELRSFLEEIAFDIDTDRVEDYIVNPDDMVFQRLFDLIKASEDPNLEIMIGGKENA